jgi:hypothetical protein
MTKNILLVIGAVIALGLVSYLGFFNVTENEVANNPDNLDPTPRQVTLSGTYVCLPHLDTTGPQTEECAFGLQTDDGDYYAVNFGASQDAMTQFMSGEHITADGFVVIKEALSTDQWAKYNMKGIFTITNMMDVPSANTKLDITAVCESALAYMTFPDGASADKFIAECKEGEHPEVVEQYKQQMGLDGANI